MVDWRKIGWWDLPGPSRFVERAAKAHQNFANDDQNACSHPRKECGGLLLPPPRGEAGVTGLLGPGVYHPHTGLRSPGSSRSRRLVPLGGSVREALWPPRLTWPARFSMTSQFSDELVTPRRGQCRGFFAQLRGRPTPPHHLPAKGHHTTD